MPPPQLRPTDSLHRAAKSLDIQGDKVLSSAYIRRPPSIEKNGNPQEGDKTGLSVGFAENEDLQAFIDRTRQVLSFRAVIRVSVGAVVGTNQPTGLGVEPFQGSEVKGNITRMPYLEPTAEMTPQQRASISAEIDEQRAVDLQRMLAGSSEVLIQGKFSRIEE